MTEMLEVFHGRFLLDLDQAVQRILNIKGPVRSPGWTMNPTEHVVTAGVPQISNIVTTREYNLWTGGMQIDLSGVNP